MTADQWLNSTDPQAMLDWLRQQGKLSDRTARLFAVGCVRQCYYPVLDGDSRKALDVAERLADEQAGQEDLAAARAALDDIPWRLEDLAAEERARRFAWAATTPRAVDAARVVVRYATFAARTDPAALLRNLFGPLLFRPMVLPPSVRTWNQGLVRRLAEEAYEKQLMPSGQLDLDRLGVLADALEESGVSDAAILGHLRQQGAVHVRGCAVLDLILGKQ